MAKGQKLKQEITQKILSVFPGSFLYNDGKEIRINGIEDSEQLQIKCVLTASKVNVNPGDDNAIPTLINNTDNNINNSLKQEEKNEKVEISQEEKDNLAKLMQTLGL